MKNLPISETYRAELEKDVLDVQALFDSKDPYLFDIAHKMQQDLEKHIDEINLNPKLYQTNKDRMDKLATQIGLLIPNLPETHRRLKTALTEQMVESKHCDPSEMSQRLDELRDHVQNALFSKLPDRAKEIEDYRKRKAEVQAKFKEMKEKTHTRVTEKSDAFETFYEARLVEASGHKSREGGVPEALAVLKNLDDMLQKVLDAENPRAQLRELDAEQQRDQQLMKDMAAQFERELGVFRSTMLKEAKAVAKKSEDGDTDLIKSLLGVANAAEKIVSPYLKNNATLPHQKAGANPSPDMKRMQHDFERARGMLAEATRTAQRLIQTPTSTNVKGPQQNGLRKILKKWHERTQAYGAAVREVAGAIRAAAANETDPQILQNAEDAARVVEGMANQFRGEAFASSFADLMKPMPKDKREREKAERAELAAREAALRIMRQFRTDLLKNPLLTKLTDKKTNPFEAATMMAAAGGLRALLKEIELQVLNSV